MITGIGVDAVAVSRFEKWAADQRLLRRFFHPKEIALCRARGAGMVQALAARFAAKEAFGKALGTGLAGFSLKDIMVRGGPGKKPKLELLGGALAALRESGAEAAHLSITHERDFALAFVVLERNRDGKSRWMEN